MKLTFRWALLVTIGGTLLTALAAGGLTLDRRLAEELERDARTELAMAPPVLADRLNTQSEALRMHADVLAESPDLRRALETGDRAAGVRGAEDAASGWGEEPIVLEGRDSAWTGPRPDRALVLDARSGNTPFGLQFSDGALHAVAITPVIENGVELGLAGVALAFDTRTAEILSGLTRADVVLAGSDGSIVASTLDPGVAATVAAAGGRPATDESGKSVTVEIAAADGTRLWSAAAPLGEAGTVYFVRSAARELAALPRLRRAALIAGGLALLVTLLVGSLLARALSRPVTALADASAGLAAGDFGTPLSASRVREMDTVSRAFAHMRRALAARIEELRDANRALEDRQARLQALQAEVVQRDRLVAAGRLVTELAHEIRNPVANVRNCLEVVRRRVEDDKAQEFTDLAIAELLRMHELAERMLDLNRPVDADAPECDAREVVEDVAALAGLGDHEGRWPISIQGPLEARVAVPPDTLKQVLLNLLANAREASPGGGPIEVAISSPNGRIAIEVSDRGHGVPEDALPHVFDPFFTTKDEVHGVGLGLFIAQGALRRHGGGMAAENRAPGPGATFRLDLAPAPGTEAA